MSKSTPVTRARSRVAVAVQRKDAKAEAEARQELEAAMLERAIQRAVEAAPPLSAAQRERLAMLLIGGGERN